MRARLRGRTPVVFLDYDGTLTPIVEDFTRAYLSDEMRAALAALSARATVAVVSGRDVDLLRRLVQLDSIFYAGSHGFDIAGPPGWRHGLEKGLEFLPALDAAEAVLRDRLTGIAGHAVERKRFSISVHYRRVAHADHGQVEAIVDAVVGAQPELRKTLGKMVFEVRPALEWDKGRAVLWLLERLVLDREGIIPIYVGDDITDEDAFEALAEKGLSILVGPGEDRPTAAHLLAENAVEVRQFIELITRTIDEG